MIWGLTILKFLAIKDFIKNHMNSTPTQKPLKFFENWLKKIPKVGDVIPGTVIAKEPRRIFFDLGPIGTGVIYGSEFIRAKDKIDELNIGDMINVKIISLENDDGYLEVSLREADKDELWERLKKLKEERAILNIQIVDANRGGLIGEIFGLKGFIPVSQLSTDHYPRIEDGNPDKIFEHLKKFVGGEMRVRIIDVSPKEEKIIFSEREAKEEDLKEIISKYNVGDIIEGEITAVMPFGAFIKFGNPPIEGLIHISEFDYKIVDDPKKYVAVGDIVKAKIISIDNTKVSLSLKALKENPWDKVLERYERDGVYPGKVLKIIPLGALVELDPEIYGLAEISQFDGNLELLKQKLEPSKVYPFRIISIEPKEKKILLKLEEK
jgi:small subunit ribosomal protein S1